jgi:hypothetical protein
MQEIPSHNLFAEKLSVEATMGETVVGAAKHDEAK